MAGAGERQSGAPLCEGKVDVLAQDAGPLLPTAARGARAVRTKFP